MAQLRSRLALIIATICLALTVIALGAAAKHSQFENAAQPTRYLTQTVKMVAGNHEQFLLSPQLVIPAPLSALVACDVEAEPIRAGVALPVAAPLLI